MPEPHQGARRHGIGGRQGAVVTVAAPQEQRLVSVRREIEGAVFPAKLERQTFDQGSRRKQIVRRIRGACCAPDASYRLINPSARTA